MTPTDVRRKRRGPPAVMLVFAVALVGVLPAAPSQAAYPEAKNGGIVFDRFFGTPPAQSDVFVMNADGSGQTNLTNTLAPIGELNPAISPNGELISFQRCDGSDCDIAIMSRDGSNVVNLTNTPSSPGAVVIESNPEFSPDGRQIAFQRTTPGVSNVLVMNTDGSGQLSLTNSLPPETSFDPTFTADGKRIFFTRCDAIACHIWAMNADGSGQVPVSATAAGFEEFEAATSPDNRWLAFYRCNSVCDIAVLDLTNGVQAPLNGTALSDFDPVFSPDMKLLAFVPDINPDPGTSTFAISTMNADGSSPVSLTSPTGSDDDTDADWEYVFRCGKRAATIVGDDGPDKIKGTKRRDVIVANGGKNKVSGRGGNDTICAGKRGTINCGGGDGDRVIGKFRKENNCEKGKGIA